VAASPLGAGPQAAPRRTALLNDLGLCDVRHEGLAIDVASSWSNAHRGFTFGPFDDVEPTERAAVPTARVLTSKLGYDVWLDRSATDVYFSLRVQGVAATRLALEIDSLRLPEQRLPSDEPRVLTFGPVKRELAAGRHTVSLRFAGRAKDKPPERAVLDWLRVHLLDEHASRYVAPSEHSVLHDVVLEDRPRRSLALRSPATVRCAVLPTRGSRLKLELGFWGAGTGTAQVRVLTQDQRSVMLAEHKVSAEEQRGAWTPLELSLDAFAGQLVALEFSALDATPGGRVAFAEPEFEFPAEPELTPSAQNVVLVIASGISRRLVPPWADRQTMPNLFGLAQQSLNFEGYRANSTLVPAVVASLLTGSSAMRHRWSDLSSRVPQSLTLLGERLRENGNVSAFFTNVPYTFEPFGFNRGWNQFAQYSPVEDLPSSEPLREGRLWLERAIAAQPEARRLLVLHLGAGHPPWDVTLDETKTLAPKDYNGNMDPRRGAQVLADFRTAARPRVPSQLDWTRLTALQEVALRKLDQSLGHLLRSLEKSGQWDRTLFVFMGDVAMGDPPGTPLAPIGNLEESRLTAPLLVRLPGASSSKGVTMTAGPESVARTLHEALGLTWPGSDFVASLGELARGGTGPRGAVGSLAVQGQQYAYTLGPWLLSGTLGQAPRLCEIEIDPACQDERFAREPFAAQWLWRSLLRLALDPSQAQVPRENAEIDPQTRTALAAFGL
jgi:hypothetical protein